jgi:hypothetical protein
MVTVYALAGVPGTPLLPILGLVGLGAGFTSRQKRPCLWVCLVQNFGLHADAVLGMDILRLGTFSIDYKSGRISFGDSEPMASAVTVQRWALSDLESQS